MWIIFNMRFPKLKYIGAELSLAKFDMPLLNWPSVEDLITSLNNTFHLQIASGINDFFFKYQVCILLLYTFPHFELYIVNFSENLQ